MREDLLECLRCPECIDAGLSLKKGIAGPLEVKQGLVRCSRCSAEYSIEGGIVNFLQNAREAVKREREAMDADDYITDRNGNKLKITEEVIVQFSDQFLALPEGDGSYLFRRGGSFQTTAEAAGRLYFAMKSLRLKGEEKILEIGACFSYASFKFARMGCRVVALDISNYLKVSQLYINKAYFERVFADMHRMPFVDGYFDIVFGSAILHHTKDLAGAFREIRRVLKPGGRLLLINEAARGVLEKVSPVFKQLEDKGFQDTSYTVFQFKRAAKRAGLKGTRIRFLSLAEDYITKHKNRGSKNNFKLRLAYFFARHKTLEGFLLILLILPRVLFRPRSWSLNAYK